MLKVDARTGKSSEGEVAHHHDLLGLVRLARQPKTARPFPLMHRSPAGKRVVFTVLRKDHPKALRVLHRSPHKAGVLHTGAVVGEHANPESSHLGHRCELLALPANGDGTRHVHLGKSGRSPEVLHLTNDCGRVDSGSGIRHRQNCSKTAEGRCTRAGLDRLSLFLTRLTQVRM